MTARWLRIFLVLALFLTTGCWNRRELNDLAITVGMAIDKADDGYKVTVQIVDPSEVASRKGGADRAPVITYESTAGSIFEALRKMTTFSTRKVYMSHLMILVFGEELAREGIKDTLDFLARDHELRSDFNVVIAKNTTAGEVLKIFTPLEKIPSQKMQKSLAVSQKAWAPTSALRMDELVNQVQGVGIDPVLTGITVKGNPKEGELKSSVERINTPAELVFTDMGITKKGKLVGWMTETESKGYAYLTNKVKSTVGRVACTGEGYVVLEVIHSESKVEATLDNGKPAMKVRLFMEANIGTVKCELDLTDKDSIPVLEKATDEKISDMMDKSVQKAKKYKADIFGFGQELERKYPKQWETLKENWDEEFVELPVTYEVETHIRRVGTINGPVR